MIRFVLLLEAVGKWLSLVRGFITVSTLECLLMHIRSVYLSLCVLFWKQENFSYWRVYLTFYWIIWQVLYRPLRDLNGIPGAKSFIVCLTGYQRQDREDIMVCASSHLCYLGYGFFLLSLMKFVFFFFVSRQWLSWWVDSSRSPWLLTESPILYATSLRVSHYRHWVKWGINIWLESFFFSLRRKVWAS